MVSILATLDAKDVMIILFLSLLIISSKLFLTVDSEPDLPTEKILVESQTMASTPSLPICCNLSISIFLPTIGFSSIFQSPVCKTTPAGVLIFNPLGSSIE